MAFIYFRSRKHSPERAIYNNPGHSPGMECTRNPISFMPNKIKDLLYKLPLLRAAVAWSKRVVLPGFEGVSVYDAGRFFIENMGNINFTDSSAAVTFNFLTALAPTLLFLFTLVPYLPLHDVQKTILQMLSFLAPNQATYDSISKIIIDFLNKEQRSLLSFSLLLTLFYSSNGMMGLMRYFDRDLTVYVKRNSFQRRWAAVKLTIMLMMVVLLSIAAIIIQTETVNALLLKIFGTIVVVKIFSMVLLLVLIFCAISWVYIYGPSLSHRFKFISPGAVFATLMCVLSSVIFFYLVNNFLNYNKVYGSIGTLIAFFAWLSLNTQIVMLGYDLNVSILLGRIHAHPSKLKDNVPIQPEP